MTMMTASQPSLEGITFVTYEAFSEVEGGQLAEMNTEELDATAGGAHQSSGSNFDRIRTEMSGSSFAGPNGAGSEFSFKQEQVHSSSWQAQDDIPW
jgi:hypothetical protein